ncbi:MAG: glycoside hydrolase family 73 protein [Deltaproteobacteria bacterium]
MLNSLIVFIIVFNLIPGNSPESKRSARIDYIETYKDVAIAEMYRTGIPASITLAQGLHESQAGSSELARKANNHFGMKCKSYWKGNTYYYKDDDYDGNNKLIESCFRNYDSVIESYIDRSNFLVGNDRYAVLFTYNKSDYESWANGLQTCGYATDKKYGSKLLKLINDFKLYEYDQAENPWFQSVK